MWLKSRLQMAVLGLVLLVAAFFGMPMRPQDIEELLHSQKQIKVEESTRDEEQDVNEDELS
jgi:hypothetical protein